MNSEKAKKRFVLRLRDAIYVTCICAFRRCPISSSTNPPYYFFTSHITSNIEHKHKHKLEQKTQTIHAPCRCTKCTCWISQPSGASALAPGNPKSAESTENMGERLPHERRTLKGVLDEEEFELYVERLTGRGGKGELAR